MIKTTARLTLVAFMLTTLVPPGAFAAARAVDVPVAPLGLAVPAVPVSAIGVPDLTAPGSAAPAAMTVPSLPQAAVSRAAVPAAAVPSALVAPASTLPAHSAHSARSAQAARASAPAAAMPRLRQAAQLGAELARPGVSDGDAKAASARAFDAAPKASAVAAYAVPAAPASARAGKLKSWLPKAAAVAGAIGVGIVAHVTGHHEAAMAVLPMMALGSVQNNPAAKDRQLLDSIRAVARPGQVISPAAITHDFGQRLGYSQQGVYEALGRLATMGHFMMLSNGHAVVLDLPTAADPQTQAAARAAKDALPLLNGENPIGHLAALARIDDAYTRLNAATSEHHATAANESVREQLRALFMNAALEVHRDAVLAFDDSLDHPGADARTKSDNRRVARDVNGWLYTNNPDVDHGIGRAPDSDVHEALLEILQKYKSGDGPAAFDEETERGFEVAWRVAKGMGPMDGQPRASSSRPILTISHASGQSSLAAAPSEPAGTWRSVTDGNDFKALNAFGTNITKLAAEGHLKPMIGREKELRQMMKTLMRDEKNNPIVVGEAGVGKSAIVDGLAQRIVEGKVPEELRGKNIIKLSLTKLEAGCTLRGQFEQRVQNVLDEVRASDGKIIVFIDEIHKIIGAGGSAGSNDLSQILLENLSRGGFSVIGATTFDKYRKIEKDAALNRRFNGVLLQPPTPAEAVDILASLKARYEKKHGVTIPEETVKAAVKQAVRYETERNLPDSALDLLDDASTEVQMAASDAKDAGQEPRTVVLPGDIEREIALRKDMNVASLGTDEKEKLATMEQTLESRVVGQDDAVQALVRAERRSRLGYKDPNKPDVYMFLGPTGVGKTEITKALALSRYDSETAITRIDMSEFMEKHSVARLTGAPPGYVGYEEGGKLTEAVRRRPQQILLLDEIDKAHPDVFNILLQAIDEGRLTDASGRTVNFKNTTIVMTANFLGAHSAADEREEAHEAPAPKKNPIGYIWPKQDEAAEAQPHKKNPIGFIWPKQEDAPKAAVAPEPDGREARRAAMRHRYITDLKAKLRPELINRIGLRRIIVFNELEPNDLRRIVKIKTADLNKRLADKRMTVALTPAAEEYLVADASKGGNKAYGARPIGQAIDEELVDALSEAELAGTIADGDAVSADYDAAARSWVISKKK